MAPNLLQGNRTPRSKKIDLEFLTFPSYARLCAVISVFIGFVISVLFFIIDISGLNTAIQWGPVASSDTETGFILLFVGPFVFGVAGFFVSIFTHRLFVWALKQFWGLRLSGAWREIS